MNQMMINDEIRITLPMEFHQMDTEEKKRIYVLSDVIPDWSAYDEEMHMIFSASWKRMNSILAMKACSMDGAKGLEKRMRIALRDRNYHFCGYIKEKLGEKNDQNRSQHCADGQPETSLIAVDNERKSVPSLYPRRYPGARGERADTPVIRGVHRAADAALHGLRVPKRDPAHGCKVEQPLGRSSPRGEIHISLAEANN